MKRLLAVFAFLLLATMPAAAQNVTAKVVTSCGAETLPLTAPAWLRIDATGTLCTSSSGGGGGGTSKTDASTFTTGTTAITPIGGLYNDAATLTSGQSGAARMTSKRAMVMDIDTSGSAIYDALTSAIPSGDNPIGRVKQTDGTNVVVTDPCQAATKLYKAFSQTATAVLVTGAASKKTYVCSMSIIAGAAEIFNLTAGTGSTCGTNAVAVMGSTTAANGLSLAANGGLTFGSGMAALAATTVNADDLCLQQSGSNRLSGSITYVQL